VVQVLEGTNRVALAHELCLERKCQLVIQIIKAVLRVDLSFVGQVDELGLELMESLNLLYSQVLVFVSGLTYTVQVDEMFTEVVDHLLSCLEGIGGVRLVSSEQVLLGVAFGVVEDIVYAGVLVSIVVGIDFEFAYDLDLLIVVG
jgi:hypothetical protein